MIRRRRWVWIGTLVLTVLILTMAGSYWGYRVTVLDSIPKRILAAERLLGAGKTAAAESTIAGILWFQPDQPDALTIRGRCRLDQGHIEQAIEILARIPVESPAYEKAGFQLATAYLKAGDLEQAEGVLRDYLTRFPDADLAREELRWLCFNQFRPREVISLLEDRLRRNPGSRQVLSDLLDSEYRQQVPFEGITYLEFIDGLKPGQPSVNLALGYAYWRIGRIDAAREKLNAALAAKPDDHHARFIMTGFLLEQGQVADAEQVLCHPPLAQDDDRYWSLLSQIAEQKQDFNAALTDLDQAIQRHGNDHRYATRRANLLRKLGRPKSEIEQASAAAYELLKVDRQLADVVESQAHHQPTRSDALRLADLCEKSKKPLQAANWRLLAPQLPERNPQ